MFPAPFSDFCSSHIKTQWWTREIPGLPLALFSGSLVLVSTKGGRVYSGACWLTPYTIHAGHPPRRAEALSQACTFLLLRPSTLLFPTQQKAQLCVYRPAHLRAARTTQHISLGSLCFMHSGYKGPDNVAPAVFLWGVLVLQPLFTHSAAHVRAGLTRGGHAKI